LTNDLNYIVSAPRGWKVFSFDVRQQEVIIFFCGVLKNPIMIQILKQTPSDMYTGITRAALTRKLVIDTVNTRVAPYVAADNITAIPQNAEFANYVKRTEFGYLAFDGARKPVIDTDAVFGALLRYLVPENYVDSASRDGYKVAILAGGYGATKGTLEYQAGKEIGDNLYDLLHSIPEMKALIQRGQEYIKSGNRAVYTLFGTPRILEDARGGFDYLVRAFINTPVQGTGADFLSFMITDINQYLLDNGLGYEQFRIMYPKHDEIVGLIREDAVDKMEDLISNITYQVEDWLPMRLKWKIGDVYEG
jgi:hypothetical protein